ncbi:MAG: hypothetical protein KC636_14475 [Myxococcales bacterium]|nr:hypothetical protein [Myxococcales bacterium]
MRTPPSPPKSTPRRTRWPIMALAALLITSAFDSGCAHRSRRVSTTAADLALTRVVLYRNGIGYFERHGAVKDDTLRLRVRKDQVNDLLKSLTVVDRGTGKAVSVSMPLDADIWASAALASLDPGEGSLATLLDALRGTEVVLQTKSGRVAGRVVMVEEVFGEPPEDQPRTFEGFPIPVPTTADHKVTLLAGAQLRIVRLSKVRGVTLRDGDLALHLHRRLDASAGEGMFQQVEVDVRLVGANTHDLVVSYVVAAPMWKPTYRVVLPEEGKGQGLLQGWAVVDNLSGEDWRDVSMSLTSGSPIAFRFDLHTPRGVARADLTPAGQRQQARVAIGETTYEEEEGEEAAVAEMEKKADEARSAAAEERYRKPMAQPAPSRGSASSSKMRMKRAMDLDDDAFGGEDEAAGPSGGSGRGYYDALEADAPEEPTLDAATLQRSTMASAKARKVSGLTQFDLADKVTVPDGTATMVALVNETVEAEETYLFRPGGAGPGFEQNPYRVVRFRNNTKFVLEPGPISIYAGGNFVGEGLSEAVGAGTSATIPFAVEPEIAVTRAASHSGDELRLTRIVRGVLSVRTYRKSTTKYTVTGKRAGGYTVLVRHPSAGPDFELRERPPGTEDLVNAYLVPVTVAKDKKEASVELTEQTPSNTTLTIWDDRAIRLIELALQVPALDAQTRAKLEPVLRLRQELGKIDTTIDGLRRQQIELDRRANETRQNLEAIKRDPKAGALRAKLSARLDEFTRDGDKLGRQIVELNSQRLEKKIELEDMIQDLDLETPAPEAAPQAKPKE